MQTDIINKDICITLFVLIPLLGVNRHSALSENVHLSSHHITIQHSNRVDRLPLTDPIECRCRLKILLI